MLDFMLTLQDGTKIKCHTHTCPKCHTRWGHPTLKWEERREQSDEIKEAKHTCPACGTKVYAKDNSFASEKELIAEAQAVTKAVCSASSENRRKVFWQGFAIGFSSSSIVYTFWKLIEVLRA